VFYFGRGAETISIYLFQETWAFRNNNQTYSFAKHLNDTAHSFGPMNKIMQILHCHKKGPHLNTIERFHIHTESIANNKLNDDHNIFPKAIFDVLSRTNHP
jgi:hypothetical protein